MLQKLEIIKLLTNFTLKLQCESQFYVIIVVHTYLLKELVKLLGMGMVILRKRADEWNKEENIYNGNNQYKDRKCQKIHYQVKFFSFFMQVNEISLKAQRQIWDILQEVSCLGV